jgi:hypothetical protein
MHLAERDKLSIARLRLALHGPELRRPYHPHTWASHRKRKPASLHNLPQKKANCIAEF